MCSPMYAKTKSVVSIKNKRVKR